MKKLVPIGKGKERKRYAQQYKDDALALADRVGVAEAARQLGLQETELYARRIQARSKMPWNS